MASSAGSDKISSVFSSSIKDLKHLIKAFDLLFRLSEMDAQSSVAVCQSLENWIVSDRRMRIDSDPKRHTSAFATGKARAVSPTGPVRSLGLSHIQGMNKLVVWYDGGCPLCRHEIALMKRLDRREAIHFLDVTSADVTCPVDRADLLARFHAEEDGRLLSGAAAFAAMWRAIPGLRPVGLAARNPLILAALERLYRVFLRLRPRLQLLARRIEGEPA